jgi:hypothetical protein
MILHHFKFLGPPSSAAMRRIPVRQAGTESNITTSAINSVPPPSTVVMLIANIINNFRVAESLDHLLSVCTSPSFGPHQIPWYPAFLHALPPLLSLHNAITVTALRFLVTAWSRSPCPALLMEDSLLDAILGCADQSDEVLVALAWETLAALTAYLPGIFYGLLQTDHLISRIATLLDSGSAPVLAALLRFLSAECRKDPGFAAPLLPAIIATLAHPDELVRAPALQALSLCIGSEERFQICVENEGLSALVQLCDREWSSRPPMALFVCIRVFALHGIVDPLVSDAVLSAAVAAISGPGAESPAPVYALLSLLLKSAWARVYAFGVIRTIAANAAGAEFAAKTAILHCLLDFFDACDLDAATVVGDRMGAFRFLCEMVEDESMETRLLCRIHAFLQCDPRFVEIAREEGLLQTLERLQDTTPLCSLILRAL